MGRAQGTECLDGRIESEAERREVRDAENARTAAMKRVDWNRRWTSSGNRRWPTSMPTVAETSRSTDGRRIAPKVSSCASMSPRSGSRHSRRH